MAERKANAANGNLLRALREGFDAFSKSRKAIARYLIDHFDEAPFLSAQQLAQRTGTTNSTVVRFAQHLGFSGYPEMMKAAWDEHKLAGGDEQMNFPVDDDFSGRAVRTDIHILQETIRKNKADDFLHIVQLLENAGSICLAGLFEAGMVVGYLKYYMVIMGLPVITVTDNSEDSVAGVLGMDEKSVVVAIGFGTAHQFLLRLIKAARERETVVVGISDNEFSEVAKQADTNLYCSKETSSFAPSLVGAFSIANALISALYTRNKGDYDAHISRLKSLPLSSDWLV
ncbi:MAG TPA: MurR/RpiR family transcriptional regulator [Actinobacteria bacterium]|nr:MurR/RpiR family transcriptional regulator [Actinomycetota bacterium]